jgi:hypothetical protein
VTGPAQRWESSLDTLTALVDRQRRYVAGEAAAPSEVWEPPSDPLPDELRPRAIVLLHETRALESAISRTLAANPEVRASPYR